VKELRDITGVFLVVCVQISLMSFRSCFLSVVSFMSYFQGLFDMQLNAKCAVLTEFLQLKIGDLLSPLFLLH